MTFHRIPMTTHEAPTDDQIALFLRLVGIPEVSPSMCIVPAVVTAPVCDDCRLSNRTGRLDPDRRSPKMKRYKFGLDFLHAEFKEFVYGYRSRNLLAAAFT